MTNNCLIGAGSIFGMTLTINIVLFDVSQNVNNEK